MSLMSLPPQFPHLQNCHNKQRLLPQVDRGLNEIAPSSQQCLALSKHSGVAAFTEVLLDSTLSSSVDWRGCGLGWRVVTLPGFMSHACHLPAWASCLSSLYLLTHTDYIMRLRMEQHRKLKTHSKCPVLISSSAIVCLLLLEHLFVLGSFMFYIRKLCTTTSRLFISSSYTTANLRKLL